MEELLNRAGDAECREGIQGRRRGTGGFCRLSAAPSWVCGVPLMEGGLCAKEAPEGLLQKQGAQGHGDLNGKSVEK